MSSIHCIKENARAGEGGREKEREQGVTVDKFWNVSKKNNFSYGVVKTMLNVHKI